MSEKDVIYTRLSKDLDAYSSIGVGLDEDFYLSYELHKDNLSIEAKIGENEGSVNVKYVF